MPPPEAQALYARGNAAQRAGTPDQVVQAPAFLEQAVAIDPDYAEAWGALALAYRHILEGFAAGSEASLPAKIRSAAGRALALDPDNADARLALILITPFYRNWLAMERELRAFVADHPRHWLGVAQLGLVLLDVGRVDESIPFQRRVIDIDPFLPVAYANMARAYSFANRMQECDSTLDAALRRWPAHPVIWNVRYTSLLFSDRAGEAQAFAMNPAARPQDFPPALIERRVQVARALDMRAPDELARAVKDTIAIATGPSAAPVAAPLLAALGDGDAAFAVLNAYFFGDSAKGVAPPTASDRRNTLIVFSPPLRALAGDARHRALLARTGLEAYYRASGSRPDFRRAG